MGEESGRRLWLHPLVILNVSDHQTRVRVQTTPGESVQRVLGCLLGMQTGRDVEVYNSFELRYDFEPSSSDTSNDRKPAIVIDAAYLEAKRELYDKVFPNYDVVGWYSTGDSVDVGDIELHKAIAEAGNENPLYLLFDPSLVNASRELPVTVYETEIKIVDNVAKVGLTPSTFLLKTVDSERIAVESVAKHIEEGGGQQINAIISHLETLQNALCMLRERTYAIRELVVKVEKKDIPYDHALLRQINSVVARLPAVDSAEDEAFASEFEREVGDVRAVTELAALTESISSINELVDLFNITCTEKHGRRLGKSSYPRLGFDAPP